MRTAVVAFLLIRLSTMPVAVGLEPATGSAFTAADAESFVGYHNKLRKGVGVEPLEWSPAIAAYAQKWADRLAAKGDLEHRPVNGEWARIYGENLAIDRSIIACAEAWRSEVKDNLRRNLFPRTSAHSPPVTTHRWCGGRHNESVQESQ